MAPNTFSDAYIAFAFWAGITAFGLTLLLLLVIVDVRLRRRKEGHEERSFIATWRPILVEAVCEPKLKLLPVLHPREQLFFLKLWNYQQESLRGTATDRLNGLARRLKCDVAARSFLKKGNRAERLLAILTLGHLRDRVSWDALADQTINRDSVSSLQAARALIKIDSQRATEHLFSLALERVDWSVTQVVHLMGEDRQAFWRILVKNIAAVDQQHWPRALQMAVTLRLELPLESILFILGNCRSDEALIAVLHIASGVLLLPVVRRYLHHPDWRVRIEVARFLSSFGDINDVRSLKQLLEDKQWGVRYQAAQSLASMPFFGLNELTVLRAQTHDVLVSDMLDQVLAERESK